MKVGASGGLTYWLVGNSNKRILGYNMGLCRGNGTNGEENGRYCNILGSISGSYTYWALVGNKWRLRYITGLCRDNGREHRNYYLGFRMKARRQSA